MSGIQEKLIIFENNKIKQYWFKIKKDSSRCTGGAPVAKKKETT
jgi:hypothetical protein